VRKSPFNWLEVGRQLARDERFKSPNVQIRRDFLDEEAGRLRKKYCIPKKPKIHTLQRIANVAIFVDQELDQDAEWAGIPLATLEVVMRVNKIDASVAHDMLENLRVGKLRFDAALKVERDLRKSKAAGGVKRPDRKIGRSRLKAQETLVSLWKISNAADLLQIDPRADWRFAFVKPHGVFIAPFERSAGFFDAGVLVSGVNHRRVVNEFIRDVMAACALFRSVIVSMSDRKEDVDQFLRAFERSEQKPRNLTLFVEDKLVLQES
jgi:hypothetical protein